MAIILLVALLFCSYAWFFTPDARKCGLAFLLEAGNQFAVGGDEGLLGFHLGGDGVLFRKIGRASCRERV